MLPEFSAFTADAPRTARRKRFERWLILGIPLLLALPVAAFLLWPVIGRLRYRPRDGDLVFQSLPRSLLVNALEGATRSRFSHCGIVASENNRWVVYEAYRDVERTPLQTWLARGRDNRFAVYRLKNPYQHHVPTMLASVRLCLGRPYDVRYRLDDEKIYCSELIYKGYLAASGRPLGHLERFGDLNWQPFLETVQRYEGGPPPLDRLMITPRGLTEADEVELVYRFGG